MIGAETLPIIAKAKIQDVVGKWRRRKYSLKFRENATLYFLFQRSINNEEIIKIMAMFI